MPESQTGGRGEFIPPSLYCPGAVHSLQLQLYQECPEVQEDPSALSQHFSVCSLLALHKIKEIILVELSPSREGREHQNLR